ncbi:MAG: hypothetical protein N2C14_14975 [Planctomycetales bacterium]
MMLAKNIAILSSRSATPETVTSKSANLDPVNVERGDFFTNVLSQSALAIATITVRDLLRPREGSLNRGDTPWAKRIPGMFKLGSFAARFGRSPQVARDRGA